jgi:hypothetical protein
VAVDVRLCCHPVQLLQAARSAHVIAPKEIGWRFRARGVSTYGLCEFGACPRFELKNWLVFPALRFRDRRRDESCEFGVETVDQDLVRCESAERLDARAVMRELGRVWASRSPDRGSSASSRTLAILCAANTANVSEVPQVPFITPVLVCPLARIPPRRGEPPRSGR